MSLSGSAETNRIAIFVSAPGLNGFVDTTKDIQDSVNDIRKRLSHIKEFQVVDGHAEADIIVTVVARGMGSTTYGERIQYTQYYGNGTLTNAPMVAETYWVSAIMEMGQYRKEFLGSFTNEHAGSMGPWGICANQIVNDLKAWATANAEQIKERRKKPQP